MDIWASTKFDNVKRMSNDYYDFDGFIKLIEPFVYITSREE